MAQRLRCYATNRKVAGSIPASVFFIAIKSFQSHYGPGVDSGCNRNEYQEHILGVKVARCVRLTTYHHPVPLSWNMGTLTSWNLLVHSRPVTGLLYIIIIIIINLHTAYLPKIVPITHPLIHYNTLWNLRDTDATISLSMFVMIFRSSRKKFGWRSTMLTVCGYVPPPPNETLLFCSFYFSWFTFILSCKHVNCLTRTSSNILSTVAASFVP